MQLSSVFFLQVFAVRSGGATGVVVKGPDDKSSVAFRFVDLKIKHIRVFNLYLYLSPHEGKPSQLWLWLFLVVEAGPGDANEGVAHPGQLGMLWKVFFNSNPRFPVTPPSFMCASSI